MSAARSLLLCGCILGLAVEQAVSQTLDRGANPDVVRLPAIADVWLSDGNPKERNSSAGKFARLKLKSIQELALIRFDTRPLVGREVLEANLFLHRDSPDKLRFIRVSTVNQDWEEGDGETPYGPANGATFMLANARPGANRPWAWPGSSVSDVIMSSGNSLGCWSERKELEGGWISVALTPQIVHALAIGDSDGLAIMDGGNPASHDNFVSSCQVKGCEPYLEVRLGGPLSASPSPPVVVADPAPERAHIRTGAIRLTIEPAENAFCWRLLLDGQPVPRWRVRHPAPDKFTAFYLEELPPDREFQLEITAVSSGGQVSPPTRLKVRSSKALPRNLALGVIRPLKSAPAGTLGNGDLRVWPLPSLVKIHPETTEVVCRDLGCEVPEGVPPQAASNSVWNGKQVGLFGARGEYVSFQLCLDNVGETPIGSIRVAPQPLSGAENQKISTENIEVYQNWYARNRVGQWQPAYCVPMAPGATFSIPSTDGRIPMQRNQTVHVDVYIPKDAKPGRFSGTMLIAAENSIEIEVPINLEVLNFTIPDRLGFWPELNAYEIPDHYLEYYRLAHRHRCVLNCWAWRPQLTGSGRDVKVQWEQYDRCVGPLLTGEAFASSRRSGVPVECMYLPFEDSWPTPLSPQTYKYEGYWPQKGDDPSRIVEHFLTAPPIAQAISEEYREAFLAVQRQFIEHFQEKGYTQTEMQCYFSGKATNRVDYGMNVWWTTDEPHHWDDWMALQYFLQLWSAGRGPADPRVWAARADISRPQWQGRTLGGLVDASYFGAGGYNGQPMVRRCRALSEDTGLNVRAYGSAGHDSVSNTENIAVLLSAWADGADAFQPWQTLGSEESLEQNDTGCAGGSALLAPGRQFGLAVVGDLRLKALRDGQQLIEYLTLLSERRRLSREQIKAMIHEATRREVEQGKPIDDADSIQLATLSDWQIRQIRRRVADLILREPQTDQPVARTQERAKTEVAPTVKQGTEGGRVGTKSGTERIPR